MIAQEELDQEQRMNVGQEKLMSVYSPPTLTILGAMREIKSPGIGISEDICGCGIVS
jgi:hypothetical protein